MTQRDFSCISLFTRKVVMRATVSFFLCSFLTNMAWPITGPSPRADSPKFGKFLNDCIRFWGLKFPKILVDTDDFRVGMSTHSYVLVGVRVNFSENFEKEFRRIVTRDRGPTQVIVVGNRTMVSTMLRLVFEAHMLIHKGTIILLCTNCNVDLDLVNGNDFLGNLILAYSLENQPNVRLRGITYNYKTRSLISHPIGNWNFSGIHIKESWLNRKFCLGKSVLMVLTTMTLPYLVRYDDPTGLSTPTDFAGALLQLMSDMLNFKFQVTNSTVITYGEMGRNGTFSGVIGLFVKQKYDLGLGVFSRTPDRQKVVDFTVPYASGKMSFAAMYPSKVNRRAWTIAIRSFDLKVWGFLIFFCGLTALAVASTLFFGLPRCGQEISWTTTFMSAWLLQGKEDRPEANSAKIIIFATCALSWTIYCFYNGVLISYLTLDTSTIISTLAELIASKHGIMMANGSSSSEMLRTTRNPSLKAMYDRATVLETTEQGLSFLCKSESLAILSGNALFYSLAKTKLQCRYYFIKEPLYKDEYHFITQKNSVLNKRLSKAVRKIRESGILSHLESFYQLRKPSEIQLRDKKESIYIRHLIGPFALLLGGMVLSVAALCLEVVYYCLNQKKRV